MVIFSTLASVTLADEKEKPDATLKLSGGSVGAGIGYTWGSGVLTYKGKEHPFKVEGISVGDVGVTNAEATGKVYHLKKLADFNGSYTSAGAAAAVGTGAGAAAMKNQHGVVINLTSTSQGVEFKFAVEGMKITLKEP